MRGLADERRPTPPRTAPPRPAPPRPTACTTQYLAVLCNSQLPAVGRALSGTVSYDSRAAHRHGTFCAIMQYGKVQPAVRQLSCHVHRSACCRALARPPDRAPRHQTRELLRASPDRHVSRRMSQRFMPSVTWIRCVLRHRRTTHFRAPTPHSMPHGDSPPTDSLSHARLPPPLCAATIDGCDGSACTARPRWRELRLRQLALVSYAAPPLPAVGVALVGTSRTTCCNMCHPSLTQRAMCRRTSWSARA